MQEDVDYVHAQRFQFHKGTIRTLVLGGDTLVCTMFQFHKGTIRTETSSTNVILRDVVSIP